MCFTQRVCQSSVGQCSESWEEPSLAAFLQFPKKKTIIIIFYFISSVRIISRAWTPKNSKLECVWREWMWKLTAWAIVNCMCYWSLHNVYMIKLTNYQVGHLSCVWTWIKLPVLGCMWIEKCIYSELMSVIFQANFKCSTTGNGGALAYIWTET